MNKLLQIVDPTVSENQRYIDEDQSRARTKQEPRGTRHRAPPRYLVAAVNPHDPIILNAVERGPDREAHQEVVYINVQIVTGGQKGPQQDQLAPGKTPLSPQVQVVAEIGSGHEGGGAIQDGLQGPEDLRGEHGNAARIGL